MAATSSTDHRESIWALVGETRDCNSEVEQKEM